MDHDTYRFFLLLFVVDFPHPQGHSRGGGWGVKGQLIAENLKGGDLSVVPVQWNFGFFATLLPLGTKRCTTPAYDRDTTVLYYRKV